MKHKILSMICLLLVIGTVLVGCKPKVKNITTHLSNQKLNLMYIGDKISCNTDPKDVEITISLDNKNYTYDNEILSNVENTKIVNKGNTFSPNIIVEGNMAYFYGNVADRMPYIQGVSIKDQKEQYRHVYKDWSQILEGYIDDEGNLTLLESENVRRILNEKGNILEKSSKEFDFMNSKRKIDELTFDGSVLTNNQWKFYIENSTTLDATQNAESNYVLYYSSKQTTFYLDNQEIPVDEGLYVFEIKNNGELGNKVKLELEKTYEEMSKRKYSIAYFNDYFFITETDSGEYHSDEYSLYVIDKDLKAIQVEMTQRGFGISKVFQIDDQTLGYYLNDRDGVILVKMALSKVTVIAGNKSVEYQTIILPKQEEIDQQQTHLYSFVVAPYEKEEYYKTFATLANFAATEYMNSQKKTFDNKDFKDKESQENFLVNAMGLLDIEGSSEVIRNGLIVEKYRMNTDDCVKAIKEYLGVEPAIDTTNSMIEIIDDQKYLSRYPNDYKVEYQEGDTTTIKVYLDEPYANQIYENGCVMTITIKGNYETRDFTIHKIQLHLINEVG